LENLCLQGDRVGINKKPIWHSVDDDYSTASLIKFAAFTLTNESMFRSLNSEISQYKLFKKMTNLRWNKTINLTGMDEDYPINFNDIVNNIKDKSLLYTAKNGTIRMITGFGFDEKT
jgi:hypothetical protein